MHQSIWAQRLLGFLVQVNELYSFSTGNSPRISWVDNLAPVFLDSSIAGDNSSRTAALAHGVL